MILSAQKFQFTPRLLKHAVERNILRITSCGNWWCNGPGALTKSGHHRLHQSRVRIKIRPDWSYI